MTYISYFMHEGHDGVREMGKGQRSCGYEATLNWANSWLMNVAPESRTTNFDVSKTKFSRFLMLAFTQNYRCQFPFFHIEKLFSQKINPFVVFGRRNATLPTWSNCSEIFLPKPLKKQEYIPVKCAPPAAVAVIRCTGSLSGGLCEVGLCPGGLYPGGLYPRGYLLDRK